MSQRSNNKMLSQLSSLLPDDRPISAIGIIEDIDKCPPNFTVVSRTYDQDSDADLWRESGLFIKKRGRYICLSKTEGLADCVVENIVVINERDLPPEGYSMIARTIDSEQKAWRKKQLCYKVRHKDLCSVAVTDIIICSRIKKAPSGFTYAGEINGITVCYKTSQISNNNSSSSQPYANINSFQNVSPNPSAGVPHRPAPERPPKPKFAPKPPNGSVYPVIKSNPEETGDLDYEVLSPNAGKIKPTRPAPRPPPTSSLSSSIYATMSGTSDLDGVPFIINSLISRDTTPAINDLPVMKVRTQKDLDKEYYYDFRVEADLRKQSIDVEEFRRVGL